MESLFCETLIRDLGAIQGEKKIIAGYLSEYSIIGLLFIVK
jgi:hypothetical protein